MSRFIARVESDGGWEPRTVTMILRSAASCPALALIGMSQDLARAGIGRQGGGGQPRARGGPPPALRVPVPSFARGDSAKELIRWARNPRLLDAHEQATSGAAMCWSGDAMRREADKRNALSLFDEEAPGGPRCSRSAPSRRCGQPRRGGRAASHRARDG